MQDSEELIKEIIEKVKNNTTTESIIDLYSTRIVVLQEGELERTTFLELTPREILDIVIKITKVPITKLKNKKNDTVLIRRVYGVLASKYTKANSTEITALINRERTSLTHYWKMHWDSVQMNQDCDKEYFRLLTKVERNIVSLVFPFKN